MHVTAKCRKDSPFLGLSQSPATLWVIWYCPLLIKLCKASALGGKLYSSDLSPIVFSVMPHCSWIMKTPSCEPVTRANVTIQLPSLSPESTSESEQTSHTGHFQGLELDSSGLQKGLLRDLCFFLQFSSSAQAVLSLFEQMCSEFPKWAMLQGRYN